MAHPCQPLRWLSHTHKSVRWLVHVSRSVGSRARVSRFGGSSVHQLQPPAMPATPVMPATPAVPATPATPAMPAMPAVSAMPAMPSPSALAHWPVGSVARWHAIDSRLLAVALTRTRRSHRFSRWPWHVFASRSALSRAEVWRPKRWPHRALRSARLRSQAAARKTVLCCGISRWPLRPERWPHRLLFLVRDCRTSVRHAMRRRGVQGHACVRRV